MSEHSAESDATPIRTHHMNTCVQCRDWGHLERHEDHWPPRVIPPGKGNE